MGEDEVDDAPAAEPGAEVRGRRRRLCSRGQNLNDDAPTAAAAGKHLPTADKKWMMKLLKAADPVGSGAIRDRRQWTRRKTMRMRWPCDAVHAVSPAAVDAAAATADALIPVVLPSCKTRVA